MVSMPGLKYWKYIEFSFSHSFARVIRGPLMISQHQYQHASLLIVDDQMTNVMLLENILQAAGYRNLHSTTDSRDVTSLFKEHNPDLILLDIRMPHLDGFQVMGQLKVINQQPYLPILVLTAEEDRETRLRALESGAKDFLNKPFDKTEVLMRIRNLLEASLLHKEIQHQIEILEQTVNVRTIELREDSTGNRSSSFQSGGIP